MILVIRHRYYLLVLGRILNLIIYYFFTLSLNVFSQNVFLQYIRCIPYFVYLFGAQSLGLDGRAATTKPHNYCSKSTIQS